METKIVSDLNNTLREEAAKLENDPKLKAYEKALIEFNKMVESGLIKRRGYTLQTFDETHLNRVFFNTRNC